MAKKKVYSKEELDEMMGVALSDDDLDAYRNNAISQAMARFREEDIMQTPSSRKRQQSEAMEKEEQEIRVTDNPQPSIEISDDENAIEECNQVEMVEQNLSPQPAPIQRRVSSKQHKLLLEEYRETFMQVPHIEDRKPVFVSREVRDMLDEYVRRFGRQKMSVSGLLENMARHHLALYESEFEQWKRL